VVEARATWPALTTTAAVEGVGVVVIQNIERVLAAVSEVHWEREAWV